MATDIRIGVGDGDVTDDINLDDGTNYVFREGTLTAPAPAAGDRYRIVSWVEDIKGSSSDDVWAKFRALQTKFDQARQAAGPYGHGTRVVVSIKLNNATNYVYMDVIDGGLNIDRTSFSPAIIGVDWIETVTVTLVCLPYFRGEPVTTTVSGTITSSPGTYATPGNTGNGGLFVADIPGDVPALVRHTITDTSGSSTYINRMRINAFSLRDPAAAIAQSAFTPWIDDTASGAGVATSDATGAGSSVSEINLTSSLQRVSSFSKPSATYMTGLFDVFVRVRDSTSLLGPPTLTAASVQNDVNLPTRQSVSDKSTSASSLAPTWPSATKAGSFLAMAVMISTNASITTPTGWTAGPTVTHANNNAKVAWFYINASASRSGAETVTLGAAVRCQAYMFEVPGARYAGALDVVPTGTSTGSTTLVIASGARAQARTLMFGAMMSSGGGATRTMTSGDTDTQVPYNGGTTYRGLVGRARSTATTTQNYTFTLHDAADNVGALIGIRAQQDVAPNIPTGTYEVGVVAASASDVSLSVLSNTTTVNVTQTDSVIYAEWTGGTGSANVDHYRVYYRLTGGAL